MMQQIAASASRICGFHVSDWLVPLPDVLLGRGMMGDGVIDIPSLRDAVDRAGYVGPIEVEILNQALWDQAPESVLDRVVETFNVLCEHTMQVDETITLEDTARAARQAAHIGSRKIRMLLKRWNAADGAPVFTVAGRYNSGSWNRLPPGRWSAVLPLARRSTGSAPSR